MYQKKQQRQHALISLVVLGIFITALTTLRAAEVNFHALDVFLRQPGPIRITLEETLPGIVPREEACALLKLSSPISPQLKGQQDVGIAYPTWAVWTLLAAKMIALTSQSEKFRINVGDWGGGPGFFACHALLSGANPYVIDSNIEIAADAQRVISGAKPYLSPGLKIRDLAKVFCGSVTTPAEKFMERQNHINVGFNIIHFLSPSQTDQFLKNLFINTVPGGRVVLCCDTPFSEVKDNQQVLIEWYTQRMKAGNRYPGYGVYGIMFDTTNRKPVIFSASDLAQEDEQSGKIKTGNIYSGYYQAPELPPTICWQTATGELHDYEAFHQAKNAFDYFGLRNVLEYFGFKVIKGWYTDFRCTGQSHSFCPNTLYPIDYEGPETNRTKVVIVAQKPVGSR